MDKNHIELLKGMSMTGNQYAFVVILFHNDATLLRETKLAVAPLPLITLDELKDLQNRKFIKKSEDGGWTAGSALVDMMEGKDIYEMFNEFFNIYPSFVNIKGKRAPLKIVDSRKVAILYEAALKSSSHHEMIMDLEYGKDNDLITMKIDAYLTSKFYLTLREERNASVNTELLQNDF